MKSPTAITRRYVFGYLRLSREEALHGESNSITTQRQMISDFCQQRGYTLVDIFSDDGWSGGNFDRPGFKAMLAELEKGKANTVITKDLSRLGRDMRESSYYAEQFFPENGIRYLTLADNFDTEQDNIMAPFQFAMNEVYLRDGSKKVRDALRSKRENGQYCACPPFGYRKPDRDKSRLIPDENTAPIVRRIFEMAAAGESSRTIAMSLNADGVIPPLKYRVLYRDVFSDKGASRMSDLWSYTTVKRILKNPVYLGHTLLGKSKKVSLKSRKKIPVPKEDWLVTQNTHEPLVSELLFQRAQDNMGKGTKNYRAYSHVRKSIFGGVAVCGRCGYSLCSAGTVYKGEREKYWFLSCTHQRRDIADPCEGVRIRYADLLELVRQDLNSLIDLSDEQIDNLVQNVISQENLNSTIMDRKHQLERSKARLKTIDKMIVKLYNDNAEGKISDDRMYQMVADLEKESAGLNELVQQLEIPSEIECTKERYDRFFSLAKQYTHIDTLDRETLLTFVDRIEVGPKILPEGKVKATHRKQRYQQSVRIFYKFIGEAAAEPIRDFPQTINF